MSKYITWLKTESERWVREGIVSSEQAGRIRGLYPASASTAPAGLSWGLIVFFGIGAVVVGLGIILLFAYNWSAIPKAGKLALVFGLVVSAHGLGLRFRNTNDWRVMLGEGLSLLGTMSFGAGIWLIAQIYHIDEHFPNGFLFWGLGALAMAWAMPSVAQALLATVVLTIWGCMEVSEFGIPVDWGSFLIVFGIGGLVWRMRSAVLAGVGLAGLYFMLLFNAGHWAGTNGVFFAAFSLSVLLIAGAKLADERYATERMRSVMNFYGVGGFLFCAYVLTFEGAADDLFRASWRDREISIAFLSYRWGLMTLALAAWGVVALRFFKKSEGSVALNEWFYPLSLLFVASITLTGFDHPELLVAVVFNLAVLGLSTMWIVRGCREGALRLTVNGSLLLAAVVFARYFDLFNSLAARGAAFVVFGGILFAEGFYYRRMRQEQSTGKEAA
jgi:uncharacterized membrane protein